MMINVFAEPKGEYEKEERSYEYQSEREDGYPPMMNDYYPQGLPIAEEYNSDRYGGFMAIMKVNFILINMLMVIHMRGDKKITTFLFFGYNLT